MPAETHPGEGALAEDSAPARRWLLPTAIALLTLLSTFVLPWALPPTHPAYGQSYVVGFNNRVAIVLIGALSLTALALGLRRRKPVSQQLDSARLNPAWLVAALTLILLWIGSLIWLVQTAAVVPGEATYFIAQMGKTLYQHRTLYAQVEFVYGSLLFYPTLWLSHLLGPSPHALEFAYYLTVLAHHLAGEGMLFFILATLPLARTMRLGMFLILSLYSLNPWLGLNYTLTRFLLTFFCLAVLSRISHPLRAAGWIFVSILMVFFTSQEQGIAFCFGALAFSTWLSWTRSRRYLLLVASVFAAMLAGYLLAPPLLLTNMRHFSGGFHHTVLIPRPDILLALAAMVWLAPLAVARAIRHSFPGAPLLIAFYAASLIMIPASFGGAGSIHVISNSLGFFLLAAVYLSHSLPARRLWLAAAGLTFVLFLLQLSNDRKYEYAATIRCADPAHRLPALAARVSPRLARSLENSEAHGCPANVDIDALTQNQPFTIPYIYDGRTLDSAVRSPLYAPGYYFGLDDVSDPEAQQVKVEELRQLHWAMLPSRVELSPVSAEIDESLMPVMHFRELHRVYTDDLLVQEIQQHWSPVAEISPSISLYHRVR